MRISSDLGAVVAKNAQMAAPAQYVFYSWQSDLPAAHNRSFIESAIEAALSQINEGASVESSPRGEMVLDKDTKGVGGSPVVTETIVKKIKGCCAFVGDLSFVAQSFTEIVSERNPVRYVPNPNVIVEYTHALDFHGEERVIAVVNEAYGGELGKNLPFNLRHRRWPIRYRLGLTTTADEKKAVRKKLVGELVAAIRLIMSVPAVSSTRPAFVGSNFTPAEFSRQAKAGDLIIDGPLGDEIEPYAIPEGCVISLRLQPEVLVPGFESEGDAMQAAVTGHLRPMVSYETSGRSWARNAMGAIVYEAPTNGVLRSLSELFLSKELFGIDAGAAGTWRGSADQHPMFHIERVEESYALTLRNYIHFAQRTLNLPPPWKISAGIYGVHNYKLAGRRCLRSEIHWSGTADPTRSVLEILTPFFNSLSKAFSVTRPMDAGQELAKLLGTIGESE